MSDRPYEGLSELRLRDVERNLRAAAKRLQREDDRFWKQRLVSDNSWDKNEDYQVLLRHKESVEDDMRKVGEEWGYRAQVARRRGTATATSQQEKGGKSSLIALACACRPPRRIKVQQQVFQAGPVLCGICGQAFGEVI